MQKTGFIVDRIVQWFVYGMLILTVFIVSVSLFSGDTEGEAGVGSFESQDFNEGWVLVRNGVSETITLPAGVSAEPGEVLIIKNTLPLDLSDGCSLLARASMEDMYIYVNGELREQYASENIPAMAYYIPSAFVVTELSQEDAGAEIAIHIRVKVQGLLNGVRIGNGNNVWFDILKKSMPVNVVALMVLILGVILICVSKIIQRISEHANITFSLGLLMVDMGIWVFSESDLRQIIFSKPSLSHYFAYFSVELLGALACMYFDEVQHRKYHKRYVAVELLITVQLAVNMILHFTGIVELYRTLLLSHLWMAVGILIAVINTCADIRSKRILQYKATAFGMVGFLLMAVLELAAFYITKFHVFGIYVCIGLVVLMVATVVQALMDLMHDAQKRQKKQTEMIINTIETIAGAIDAKDEYTGGHSERVGQYAAILARGMAADYDFSEEDILRIHYIGIMHDIGKIGVADTVLNKAGRLTEGEYSLMKKHVDIGSEIMAGMNESISGLVDGIRYHHERFDGKGYPEGLSETEIPLVARILCLADCYDAMTSNRVYRKRLTDEEVRAEFIRCSGTQFDPALTEIFVQLLDSGEMHPYTVEGMAVSEKGTVLKSAVLENRLQGMASSEDILVKHPEHVRMLCFIMKLKEKKGERVDVFFVGLKKDEALANAEAWSTIEERLKTHLEMKDVKIECNEILRIIALFDRTDEEIEGFKKDLNLASAHLYFEHI
ncbi:MAG: HD-GYP domain-containing protein [Acetatifactor sp.]